MEINFGGSPKKDGQSVNNKKSKEDTTITANDLQAMQSLNERQLLDVEKQAEIFTLKQMERDRNWDEIQLELHENIGLLKESMTSMNENLSRIKKDFAFLLKNFKNGVKKTELDFVKSKVDALHFEELAIDDNFVYDFLDEN